MNIKILKRLLIAFGVIVLLQGRVAKAAEWTVDAHDYRYDMSMYASFTLSDTQLDYDDYTFGAFVGEECRGVGVVLAEGLDSPVVYMRVYSNQESGEIVTFKVQNIASQAIYSQSNNITFEADTRLGMPSAPYNINFTIPVSGVTLSQNSVNIKIGETLTLTAAVTPDNASNKNLIWSSSNSMIASVNNGQIIGLSDGTTVITATANNGVCASATVKVEAVECESITLNLSSYQGVKGESLQLIATILPVNTTDKNLTWITSNNNVATVDGNGLVEFKGMGNCVITVSCGIQKAECSISVSPPALETIAVTPNTISLEVGKTRQLSVTYTPSDALAPIVTWSSNNTAVATVNNSGLVTALATGSAIITASASDGKIATANVTVSPVVVPVSSIEITPSGGEIQIGGSIQLTAKVFPEDATNKSVSWSSGNTNVATVSNNGTVTGKGVGTATITVTGDDGVKAAVQVRVNGIECSSITVSPSEYTGITGSAIKLTATVSPENTTDKTVAWSSSDTEVATVNSSGLVSLNAVGKAVITAKCGNKSATSMINVINPTPESIDISPQTAVLEPGKTIQLFITFIPSNAQTDAITWLSNNDDVATVSNTGLVTAKSDGNVTISATTAEGKVATASITVQSPVVEVTSVTLTPETAEILVGETVTFYATISPLDASDQTLNWSSSNSDIATVARGVVIGVAPGHSVITVAANNGVKATANVTVVAIECSSITLDVTEFSGKVGETVILTATVTPENVTDKTVTWKSSNSAVATVDNSGVVTLVAEGRAKISVSCGNQTAVCDITVIPEMEYIEVLNVKVEPSEILMFIGEEYKLQGVITPENATDQTLEWSSTADNIVSVDNGWLKAIGEGNSIIRATAVNGVYGECVVTCREEAGVEAILEVTEVNVYDLNGVLIKSRMNVNTLKNLPHGIYLVKTASRTYKVIL